MCYVRCLDKLDMTDNIIKICIKICVNQSYLCHLCAIKHTAKLSFNLEHLLIEINNISIMPKEKEKISKTNAARLLDRAKIAYELIPYEVDESDLSAPHVAEQLGEDIDCVFKTLVLHGERSGHFVCVVPGEHEVDLKMAARVSGNKKCDLIHVKELLPLTGYIRGGCSPIGMKKPFPTYIHETCLEHPFIYVSAGQRGLQLKLAPQDLIRATGAEVCRLF